MLGWIFAFATVGLLGILVKIWQDHVKNQQQLVAIRELVRQKTQGHLDAIKSIHDEIAELEEQIAVSRDELSVLEENVLHSREQLADLEEQLERRLPRHRVERDDEDEGT